MLSNLQVGMLVFGSAAVFIAFVIKALDYSKGYLRGYELGFGRKANESENKDLDAVLEELDLAYETMMRHAYMSPMQDQAIQNVVDKLPIAYDRWLNKPGKIDETIA